MYYFSKPPIEDLKTLQTLPRVLYACHLAERHSVCLKGTRTDFLHQLETWAKDPLAQQKIYWLNGPAGSGKSTIAQDFCTYNDTHRRLGASFFFSRNYTDRIDLDMIFSTLSFQLACRFPDFRAAVVHTLRTRPDIGKESLDNQLKELFIDPLKATGLSTTIVIDALDEFEDTESASTVLSLLAPYMNSIPSVKFFITARPEPSIQKGFCLPLIQPLTTVCFLDEITRAAADHDIEPFPITRLSKPVRNRNVSDWRASYRRLHAGKH